MIFQEKMSHWIHAIIDCIYPSYCVLCQVTCVHNNMLCKACQLDLPWQPAYCYQCALPFIQVMDFFPQFCGVCLTKKFYFDRTLCPWCYEPPISQYITLLKFKGQLHYAQLLGALFTEYLKNVIDPAELPEAILPMPLYPGRLRQRGFNQALEIARPIAKQFNIPIVLNMIYRQKNTIPQLGLTAKERRRNVRYAFNISEKNKALRKFLPKYIAIVDDVMTTGSTVNALSQVLKQQGVKRVEVWSCARAIIK